MVNMLKTLVSFLDDKGLTISTVITHYTTLKGFKRYGMDNYLKSALSNNERLTVTAIKIESFDSSSQLYSNNLRYLGTIDL